MDTKVKERFLVYPHDVKAKLLSIRNLIFDLAKRYDLGAVHESLKWGEPSYSVKSGSPIRMDWKEKTPDYYALYFNCNTQLVDTFKEIHGDLFSYQGNRALIFGRSEKIPAEALCQCISMALRYKLLRNLPLLGGR